MGVNVRPFPYSQASASKTGHALAVADLIYNMDKGRMVSSLSPRELMANERMLETYVGIAAR
jgi:ABC-type branched-subunit amino acid transport system ATPase component